MIVVIYLYCSRLVECILSLYVFSVSNVEIKLQKFYVPRFWIRWTITTGEKCYSKQISSIEGDVNVPNPNPNPGYIAHSKLENRYLLMLTKTSSETWHSSKRLQTNWNEYNQRRRNNFDWLIDWLSLIFIQVTYSPKAIFSRNLCRGELHYRGGWYIIDRGIASNISSLTIKWKLSFWQQNNNMAALISPASLWIFKLKM